MKEQIEQPKYSKWNMVDRFTSNHISIYTTDRGCLETICHVFKDERLFKQGENGEQINIDQDYLANARLIASAPELLDALERFVNVENVWHEAIENAEKVIARAKGLTTNT